MLNSLTLGPKTAQAYSLCQKNGVAENWMMELSVKLAMVTEKSVVNGIVGRNFLFFLVLREALAGGRFLYFFKIILVIMV